MLSLIDLKPMQSGWGRVYQSGVFASEDWDDPGLIVSLSGNENVHWPCLWVNLSDNDTAVLSDPQLMSMVEATLDFLHNGLDVLIHCNEGKYRSTYMDVAVHMASKMSFLSAYTLVQKQHPIAQLRAGTQQQLIRLEPTLKGVTP